MQPRFITALGLLGVAAMGTSGVVGAGGEPVVEHWQNQWDEVIENFCDVEGLTIREVGDFSGLFHIVDHGKDGIDYFMDTYNGSVVFTNVDTGKSFTLVNRGMNKDLTVTDNGDGTLTIVWMGTGVSTAYDTNGRRLFSDPGQTRFGVVVDHMGTPGDPFDDEWLYDIGVLKGSTGLNGMEGRDFCEDVQLFTS